MEWLFLGFGGHVINLGLRRLTVWWWRQKLRLRGFPMQFFEHDFRATRGESKNHPNDHQRYILAAFHQRLQAHEERCGFLNHGR